MTFLNWFFVLVAMLVGDYFWARWAYYVSRKDAEQAAGFSILIVFCSGFTIVEYTENHWLLIPAAIGAALGTFIAVKPD